MNIEFVKDNNILLLIYSPYNGYDGILQTLNEQGWFNVKYCFNFKLTHLIDDETEYGEDEIVFNVASLVGEFYYFSKDILGTENEFYMHQSVKIKPQMFVSQGRISIMRKIDTLVKKDVYIGSQDNPLVNFPINEFEKLIKCFPSTYELKKYANSRIAYILKNHFDGLGNIEADFDVYLRKKTPQKFSTIYSEVKPLQKEVLQTVLEKLETMLYGDIEYLEPDWQPVICDIIRIIYPKYIYAKREFNIGTDGRHQKKPDFLLVDVNGFVDVLEIKKPDKIRLITNSEYRYNYVADRDLSGAIVQIEKYIYTLNTCDTARVRLSKEIQNELSLDIDVKVVNPQGFLLMGRSNELSPPQRDDFEIIKRQYKNIVDIITYDDLILRIKNMLRSLDESVK